MNYFISTTLSLAAFVALAACASPPSDLDLSLTHASAAGKYIVKLQPPATPAALDQLHAWQVVLASPAGAPVAHARITVDGGMP
jgi:hypothetical protein